MRWHVGTSGWGYAAWRGTFYPDELPDNQRLSYYARFLDAVEINTSFYHLPKPQQIRGWEAIVPKDFTFTVKGSRYITHMKRLAEPEESLPKLMTLLEVQKKPSPVIFQLPPRFPKNAERLEAFLSALPGGRRYAIEFRDPDWHSEDIYTLLRAHNVGFCLFEKGELRSPKLYTADFSYVRLHGRKEGYKGCYSQAALRAWHRWLAEQRRDAYIFFDNTDEELYALENAQSFRQLAEKD